MKHNINILILIALITISSAVYVYSQSQNINYTPLENCLYEISDNVEIETIEDITFEHYLSLEIGNSFIQDVEFSPDGNLIAASTSVVSPNVTIWDIETGDIIAQLELEYEFVGNLAFNSDGTILAVVVDLNKIVLWWWEDGGEIEILGNSATENINDIIFLVDDTLVSLGRNSEGVLFWNLNNATVFHSMTFRNTEIIDIVLLNNTSCAVVIEHTTRGEGGTGYITIINLDDFARHRIYNGLVPTGLAFNPLQNELLVNISTGILSSFDLNTGRIEQIITQSSPPNVVSGDGNFLLNTNFSVNSSEARYRLSVHNLRTKDFILEIYHTAPIFNIQIDSTNNYVSTTNSEGLHLWMRINK